MFPFQFIYFTQHLDISYQKRLRFFNTSADVVYGKVSVVYGDEPLEVRAKSFILNPFLKDVEIGIYEFVGGERVIVQGQFMQC